MHGLAATKRRRLNYMNRSRYNWSTDNAREVFQYSHWKRIM